LLDRSRVGPRRPPRAPRACPDCGEAVDPLNPDYCPRCGKALLLCPNCGGNWNLVRADGFLCRICGERF
jgi:predicted amidophosphoribosyltransferase